MAQRLSFSLAAYLALARRGSNPAQKFPYVRPEGIVLWGHATSAGRVAALLQIATRLKAQSPEVSFLLTILPELNAPQQPPDWVTVQAVPDDTLEAAEAFLEHWRPDLCIWTGGVFRPALIHAASSKGVAMFLIDVDEDGLSASRQRWLPELTRASLKAFDVVFARSDTAAQLLRRLGLPGEEIEVAGPLQEGSVALEHHESERDEMAQILAGRPVWLAAMVQPDELGIVLDAFQAANRFALRLLLVLVPDDETDGAEFSEAIKARGLSQAVWSEGEVPDESSQVLLADTWGDLGLWYRLAPITFMASSLTPGHGGKNPYEPAALGSAVLYGPHVGRFLASYSRFAAAGAARIVKDADSLAAALQQLMAPDQAAMMAAAGWDVASQGAEVTDRVIDMVQDMLDLREKG